MNTYKNNKCCSSHTETKSNKKEEKKKTVISIHEMCWICWIMWSNEWMSFINDIFGSWNMISRHIKYIYCITNHSNVFINTAFVSRCVVFSFRTYILTAAAIQLCQKLLILIEGKIKDSTNDDNNHDYDDEF